MAATFAPPPDSTLCRCRWCDRNDIPLKCMAVYSYKLSYGGFTGVCKDCINSEAAEAAYEARIYSSYQA